MPNKATVEGEVIVRDGTGNSIEFYTEEFIVDDAVRTAGQARSIIKKGFITDRLRKTVEGFKRVRTCQVVEFQKTSDKPENSELDQLLLKAAELECIPENIDNYKRPDYKQKALERAIAKAEERKAKAKPDAMKDLGEVD